MPGTTRGKSAEAAPVEFIFCADAPQGAGDARRRVQILRTGSWHFPDYGEVDISPADLKRAVTNFANGSRGQDIPVNIEHKRELGAIGWYRQLHLAADGQALYADIEFTDEGKRALKEGRFRYFSPELDREGSDPEARKRHGFQLVGGALTNYPRLKRMAPILAASEQIARALTDDPGFAEGGAMAPVSAPLAFADAPAFKGAAKPFAKKGAAAKDDAKADDEDGDAEGDEREEGEGAAPPAKGKAKAKPGGLPDALKKKWGIEAAEPKAKAKAAPADALAPADAPALAPAPPVVAAPSAAQSAAPVAPVAPEEDDDAIAEGEEVEEPEEGEPVEELADGDAVEEPEEPEEDDPAAPEADAGEEPVEEAARPGTDELDCTCPPDCECRDPESGECEIEDGKCPCGCPVPEERPQYDTIPAGDGMDDGDGQLPIAEEGGNATIDETADLAERRPTTPKRGVVAAPKRTAGQSRARGGSTVEFTEEQISRLVALSERLGEGGPDQLFARVDQAITQNEQLMSENSALQAQVADAHSRVATLEATNELLAMGEQVDALVKKGLIAPAEKDDLVGRLVLMADEDATWLMSFLGNREPIVQLGEIGSSAKTEAFAETPETPGRAEIHAQIQQYAEAHGLSYKDAALTMGKKRR